MDKDTKICSAAKRLENKGDDENPVYRSRLVGKEFNDGSMDGIFAGTPPLEALRYIIHEAATVEGMKSKHMKVVMINDVARAFFEAKATRQVCVELPSEGLTEEDRKKDLVGILNMSLYGTRDAATNLQKDVAKEMTKWGFERGNYNPCLYWHRRWNIQTLIHGDDFVSVGNRDDIRKFKQNMESRFEIKTTIVGEAPQESQEGRVLSRIIRITNDGWEYEPDQRHADMIIDALGLQHSKGVSTPAEEEKAWEEEGNNEELGSEKATLFRRVAARANYLALGRADIQYAMKEICRGMASPTVVDRKELKR